MTREYTLVREQVVARPLAEVFAFFSDAANLEAITPDSLRFRILSPEPIAMRAGARIDYRLSLFGVPFQWRTRIDAWEPGRRFVDVQERGPYRHWHHTHEFAPVAGGTRVRDTVRYALPLGPLGALAHALFVRRQVEAIFDHRRRRIEALLEAPRPPTLAPAFPGSTP
jgi:ligand-binding SRPBCC domain-containing protein